MRTGFVAGAVAALLLFGATGSGWAADAKTDQQKADEAKKKAEDAKKKAEEAKKKAEEQIKKQDDPKNWPARDLSSVKAVPCAVCVYIKDAGPKKNHEAGVLEGKIKNDGSDGKGWPPEWLARAENGAVLVLFSGDMKKVVTFDKTTKNSLNKEELFKGADAVLKQEADRKALADAKAKEEAARNPPPKKEEPAVPGLDGVKKPEQKKKPSDKGPLDE